MVRHIQIWAVWRGCRWSQTYIHTSIHTFFICIYIYRSLYIYIHKHIHIDICIYIYIYRSSPYTQTCTYIYIYLCTYIYIYIYIYKYIYIYTYTYDYIYIYTYIIQRHSCVWHFGCACDVIMSLYTWVLLRLSIHTDTSGCCVEWLDYIVLLTCTANWPGECVLQLVSRREWNWLRPWDGSHRITGVFFLGQWKPWLATE